MIWRPDTCLCVLRFSPEGAWDFIHRCRLHKIALPQAVIDHNRQFNLLLKPPEEIEAAKAAALAESASPDIMRE